jgi:NAD(P)-dependent dehydrogenase (short-subunit alcohol dehydrogenase family)
MKLNGKVAVVTGGTDGMGAVTARLFAEEGAKVIIAARNEQRGIKVENDLRNAGGEVRYVKADVSQPDDVRHLMRETESLYGALHVLYNNAAVFWPVDDNIITEVSDKTWAQVIAINLTSVFLCSKYAIPLMLRSGGGSIISTSSTGGILGLGNTAYGASKAGVINLMKNVAMQFGDKKIRANTIIPGITETPMVMELFSDPQVRREWEEKTPVGRFGKPEEIAKLALYLASDDSGYVTGTEFLIDGGFCAR